MPPSGNSADIGSSFYCMEQPAALPLVLLVDDEKHIVDNLREFLQHDFRIVSAIHPHAAIEILQQQPVDIIISDLRLPDMSGIDLLKRSIEIAPNCERILIT